MIAAGNGQRTILMEHASRQTLRSIVCRVNLAHRSCDHDLSCDGSGCVGWDSSGSFKPPTVESRPSQFPATMPATSGQVECDTTSRSGPEKDAIAKTTAPIATTVVNRHAKKHLDIKLMPERSKRECLGFNTFQFYSGSGAASKLTSISCEK